MKTVKLEAPLDMHQVAHFKVVETIAPGSRDRRGRFRKAGSRLKQCSKSEAEFSTGVVMLSDTDAKFVLAVREAEDPVCGGGSPPDPHLLAPPDRLPWEGS